MVTSEKNSLIYNHKRYDQQKIGRKCRGGGARGEGGGGAGTESLWVKAESHKTIMQEEYGLFNLLIN